MILDIVSMGTYLLELSLTVFDHQFGILKFSFFNTVFISFSIEKEELFFNRSFSSLYAYYNLLYDPNYV